MFCQEELFMNKTEAKRQMIIEKTADHLLLHGLRETTLRKLAVTAGVSDRMLMHYFTNKEELIQAALTVLTARLVSLLESSRAQTMPFEEFLPYLAQMMKHPQVRPFLRLSLELAALTAEGKSSYVAIAQKICNDFYLWMASAIQVEREEDRLNLAALAFATTEGFMVLDALGSESIVTSAIEGLTARSW
jgi:AcrR family transcriptional regulator